MVSIYSLRPVYTFVYTTINGNVIASFVQKEKSFEILWSKKLFLRTYATLNPSLPTCRQSHAFGLTPPLLLCVYGVGSIWMTPRRSSSADQSHSFPYISAYKTSYNSDVFFCDYIPLIQFWKHCWALSYFSSSLSGLTLPFRLNGAA